MLESLAANLLNRILGSYVENFDSKQLNVGIWSGDVKLKNLKLRKESLDALDLPIDVRFGFLGELTLLVPWSSLKNKPVKILIEDVYLLCGPRDEDSLDDREDEERELRLKLQRLDELELLKRSQPQANEDPEKNESFTQSLITKIVDNLQVSIKNIHIRYEDMDGVFSKTPYSVGITLSELSAVSTDENWEPSFISITKAITHKLLTLDSLCVYWNTNTTSIYGEDHEELFERLKDSISNKNGVPDHQFLLRPVTGSGRLTLNKGGASDECPHINIRLIFEEFGFDIDNCQYQDILYTMSKLHWYQKTLKFKRNRPNFTVGKDPKGWFRYAAQCVLQEIHDKNYYSSWDYIKWRREKREEYIQLWKKKLESSSKNQDSMSEFELEKLDELHRVLSFDDIKFFRALARKEYLQEKLGSKGANAERKEPPTNNKGGWFSSWWNGDSSGSQNDDLVMTEEQKQELYDAIEFNENQDVKDAIEIPRERVTTKVSCLLNRGSLSIKNKTKGINLGEIIFEDCEAGFYQRPDSFLATFKLDEFKIEDGSPNTLYKHIVSVKNLQLDEEGHTPELTEPFFQIAFEQNPLDDSADSKVDVKLRSMTVFYHVHFINEIIKLFKPPKRHLDTIGAIMNAAEATVEGWTVQTRMGLESILEDHKTINLNLDLQAPLIIIPLDPHIWDTPCAVLDAGHISIISDLVPKHKLREIKGMSPDEYEKIASRDIKRLMFDRFKLQLKDTQLLIGPDIRSTISNLSLNERDSNFVILDRMEIELDVDVSILPKAFNLPKVRTYGKLPILKLSLNDYQYKIIMQMIDKCIPDFGILSDDDDDTANDDESENDDETINVTGNNNQSPQKSREITLLRQTMRNLEKMSKAELEQRLLQLKFDVEVIQLSLYKCVEAKTMQSNLLINLIGNGLYLKFAKKPKDMEVQLDLHSFNIEDFIARDEPEEFRKLIASTNIDKEGEKLDLFKLRYNRSQRIVTHHDTLIEVFDQDINLNLTELKFVLTPKSILTLLNYVLTTFTDPNATEMPVDALKHNSADVEDAPQKMNVAINMGNIIIVLNDESTKLATLELSAGEIKLFMLPEKMLLKAKLGGLDLTNEVYQELPRDSPMRKIISMSDHELAELTYETFDVANNNNNYSSKLDYRTGSMNINFVEDAVNRIVNYLAKFQKMKGLFDRAREAAYNQAGSIESVNNIKMNIVIKAPVITFPKLINPAKLTYDHVTFYLGEFFIDNNFIESNDSYINQIKAGVRSGTLSSLFHMEHNVTQNLHIIQNLDIHFDIEHINTPQHGQPKFKINGCFEPLYANLTELQLQFIYILSNSLPSAFIIDYDDNLSDIEDAALNVNSFISPEGPARVTPDVFEDSDREESFNSAVQDDEPGSAVELTFNAPHISLTLYTDTHDIYEIESKSITTITLHDFGLAMKAKDDTSFRAETHVSSFTVEDTRREKDNKHPEIIPKIASDSYQFTASLTREKLEDFDLINLIATVDNPKVILALDYLFALKSFFDASLNVKAPARISESSDSKAEDSTQIEETDCDHPLKFQYSLNIVESSIILLSDAADKNSEAIVFNVGQLLLTDQNITSASANNVGMFLCKMGSFKDNRIRLLDDFSSSVVVDDRNSTADKLLTNIQFSVEPLTMRLSLRDIRLAMSIFNKAMAMARKHGLITDDIAKDDDMSTKYGTFSKEFKKTLSKYAPSVISSLSNLSTGDGKEQIDSKAILKAEKLNADIEGLRLVLIGDVHELPILDMNIKPFTVSAKDWSSDIEVITSIETYANIFNYSRSSWEPLVENIPISFHLSKSSENDAAMVFDVVSRKIAEVTLSSRSIALLSQIPEFLYDDKDLNPRGAEKPYKIFNDTGLDLNIWIAMKGSQEKRQLVNLRCGEKIDWEFEDWRKVRENLDTNSNMNILGVEVANKSYETVLKIDTTSEGEEVYTLQPAVNGVHTRLACDLKLCEDNIKLVTIRSTFVLENSTSNDLEFMLNDDSNFMCIKPGETRSVPAEKAFNSKLFIRPAGNYEWSDKGLSWKSLLSHPQSISCRSQSDKSLFYFEIDGKYDENEPLARIFPHMKIIVSSPLILENLLPYDMKYKLFWKPDEQNGSPENHMETRYLEKGACELIHSVTLEDFLLLALQPVEEGISMSDECLINTPMNSELKPERRVTLKYDNGQRLYLNLHYRSVDGSRAKIITIFASYVVLNGTCKDLQIEGDRGNICFTEVSLAEDSTRYSKPKMFSFDHQNDNHNRARIKFKDCDWSVKTSFDAIGQSVDLTMNIPNKNQESNIGVTVSEGEGRYALTKVIEIQPRYIVRNNLKVDLEVSEYGSNSVMTVSSGVSVPLYKMRNIINKHLILKFLGSDSEWSSPFMVKDIGSNYVKVLKNGSGHQLLKLDIILEKATIFIHISDAGANWPFSIRNFSDYEFIFYQRDPRMFDSDEDYDIYDDIGEIDYEPFYYRVPARSVMPYAWDYPAARQKKLILVARQRKREIQLAEIGNLKPMRLPARIEGEKSAIVDLNVVADGPTQALVISNYKPELSLYKLRTSQTSSSLSTDRSDKFEIQDEDKNIYTRVVVSFEGLGISLINTRLQELCYITLSGLELRYNESDLYQMLSFKLKWMQIDNQLFGGIYPNILYPTAIQNTSKELSNHPVLSGSVSKVKDDSHGVLYLKHATLLLQELSIQLDEDFLMALIEFARIPGASWVTDVKDTLCDEIETLPHPQELRRNNDIYFEVFHLQPTMLHLSFVRTEHLNVEEEKVPQQNALMFFVNVLTMALGNINNAPIKLNSLFMDNVKVPLPMLLSAIQTHYGQQFFYQIHKILGSADFLGNPVGLFNNVSSGVWDIFYEPYQGYMLNDRPQELGISIAKGGLSFVKKSVFGLSDSFARFTGSVAKGLSAATQDVSFQEQRRLDQRKARANQSFNGFSSGATSFVNDLGSGLRGVAYDPFVSASREGVPGLLKGLTKGLVGLPTKTVIGMLDLASNVSEGIRNTTTVMDASLTSRVRLPRYVGYDQIIKPFNLRESQGQYWLKSANGGECISDKYLAHVVLPGKQMAVIVSMSHVIEVRLSSLEILWKVSYTDVRAMTLERAGLVITLKNASTDLFVPISDSEEKRFLYKNISIAVGEYNKYCQAEL